jgi:hypothetical protein
VLNVSFPIYFLVIFYPPAGYQPFPFPRMKKQKIETRNEKNSM